MKYINLELNPALLYTTYDRKHSFYEDVLPSERVEACGVCLANFDCDLDDNCDLDCYWNLDDNVDKDNNPPKLTLTKKNKNIFKSKK